MTTCKRTGDKLIEPLRYPTADDLHLRLNQSYIRYKGMAVYVSATQGVEIILEPTNGTHLGKIPAVVHSSSEHVDVSNVPTGFIQNQEHAYYLQRTPRRRGRQGLCSENTSCLPLFARHDMLNIRHFNASAVGAMVEGIYPSFADCFKRIMNVKSGKTSSYAFHRHFAVLYHPEANAPRLFFKDTLIGLFDGLRPGAISVSLFPEYNHSFFTNELIRNQIGVS